MYFLTRLLQQWGPHGPHYGPMGGAGGFGSGIHWGVWLMLLTLIVLVAAAYLVGQLRREQNGTESAETQDEALAVLRQRYAAGEIDEEELKERQMKLSATRRP